MDDCYVVGVTTHGKIEFHVHSAGRYLDNIAILINTIINILRKMLLTILSKDRAIKDGLYNNLVFVMQLCLLVIATQVCT